MSPAGRLYSLGCRIIMNESTRIHMSIIITGEWDGRGGGWEGRETLMCKHGAETGTLVKTQS